tara:strand:- start:26 stop:658 length:633 start_codon:yes stop_codon:yes gene_type:complete
MQSKAVVKNFNNMGFLDIKLPQLLFNSLKKECKIALNSNKEMKSGLSGKGVATHRYIQNKKNLKELNSLLTELITVYRQNFKLDPSRTKTLTNNLPFKIDRPWINYQKKYEFIPQHSHDGIFSYTIWIDLPDNEGEHASTFQFTYSDIQGILRTNTIKLNKKDNGRMLFFPSTINHQVYPFYNGNKKRISISGNILFNALTKDSYADTSI